MTTQTAPAAVQFSPLDVLTAATIVVTARGYYQPLSRPDEKAIPTAMDVTALLYGRPAYERGDLALFARTRRTIEGTPAAVLGWCAAGTGDPGSYRERLARIAAQKTVSERDFSMLCSAVASFQKDQARAARAIQQAADTTQSQHVGEKGERITRTVTVAAVIRLDDSGYGYTVQRRYLIKLRDEAGSILIWSAKTDNVPARDSRITITGTVTKHDTYQATAQTYIARCRWTPAAP